MRTRDPRKSFSTHAKKLALALGLAIVACDAVHAQQVELTLAGLPRLNAGTSEGELFGANTPIGRLTMLQEPEAIGTGLSQPPAVRPATSGPIEILPLSVPNINTEGIGTGARPTDATLGRLPAPQPLPTGIDRSALGAHHHRFWEPSGICHKPLYFQEVMLERHGHERYPCLQPMISGARFFGTLPILPYMMTLHPPSEDLYNLGYHRPGSLAPSLRERPPFDGRAMGVQTIVTGTALGLLPL